MARLTDPIILDPLAQDRRHPRRSVHTFNQRLTVCARGRSLRVLHWLMNDGQLQYGSTSATISSTRSLMVSPCNRRTVPTRQNPLGPLRHGFGFCRHLRVSMMQ